ncbi:NADH dehydrogenase [ubiquinone] 1 beta subcomplex subunit 5, mitochondrial-like [Penaeus japonicus]|uniref:NADH dehydrogenase [ubiquinone] 1 beta subcomplex subunit 5, mitochondrial-like n=1 Tax=Penaeus japonicus TaxID=27405 RepID=UPI001C71460C|nr:NADH dehydrogenase [ubiquinone] 1 beta subcomplex subunit 5, mitochondrial-like [Penaeus japonicus]
MRISPFTCRGKMSVLSCLRSGSSALKNASNAGKCMTLVKREMGSHGPAKMFITPSRWQWHKFKDMFHFYVVLGLIPVGLIVFASNVLVGPAKLAPIPEDYVPKNWEYYSHPISRFLARYVYTSHQQDYEKYLHFMYEENEKKQMRLLEKKVRDLMAERGDTQAYYYRPILTKYHQMVREQYQNLKDTRGL